MPAAPDQRTIAIHTRVRTHLFRSRQVQLNFGRPARSVYRPGNRLSAAATPVLRNLSYRSITRKRMCVFAVLSKANGTCSDKATAPAGDNAGSGQQHTSRQRHNGTSCTPLTFVGQRCVALLPKAAAGRMRAHMCLPGHKGTQSVNTILPRARINSRANRHVSKYLQ
jgi:hypothetical protein